MSNQSDTTFQAAAEIVGDLARRTFAPTCLICHMPLGSAVEEWVGLCSRCEDEQAHRVAASQPEGTR